MSFWRPEKIEITKPRTFSEVELNLALAAIADEHPLWRAVHQLIDTAEDNAIEQAGANMDPPTVLAGYVGGAGHLRMLREELYSRREIGRELLKKP